MNSNRTQIGILGGSFDPITKGHIALAQTVIDHNIVDFVWITPCFTHMYNKKMASTYDRIRMCELAVASDKRLKVFDYEIKNKLRGETYHFVKRLLEESFAKDVYDFSIIIGLDNANTFDKWVNYELLEKMIRFVVVPRKGVERDLSVDWYLKPPHIFMVPENSIPEVSSTQVRNLVKGGKLTKKVLSTLVHPDVMKHITDNKLYRR